MNLIIKEINTPEDLIKVFKLRIEVFTFEQNCPIEEEFDLYDNLSKSTQFIVENEGECIGTARITFYTNNKIKIERVCVKKDKRNMNVGSELMERLHYNLVKDEVKVVEISAQTSALKFYKNLGYLEEGPTYLEAGLEHIKMIKKLT